MLLNGVVKIEEIAVALRLRCGCQFPWCALALMSPKLILIFTLSIHLRLINYTVVVYSFGTV
jgi:hypothetical protein